MSDAIPALRTWTTPHLCHRLLLCCSIIVSDIPGRNGWVHYCFRYTGSQWLGPMLWSTLGHLPSPHVCPSLTFHICFPPSSFHKEETHLQFRVSRITYLGQSLLAHADLNLSLSLARSCDSSGGQGHAVIDQCRGGSHRVPRTTQVSVSHRV